jgi:hypothetical protein
MDLAAVALPQTPPNGGERDGTRQTDRQSGRAAERRTRGHVCRCLRRKVIELTCRDRDKVRQRGRAIERQSDKEKEN